MLSPFTDDQLAKIESTVAELFAACDPLRMPFSTVSKFVDRLKADSAWTAEEIVEMQTRDLRIILYRQQQSEKKST